MEEKEKEKENIMEEECTCGEHSECTCEECECGEHGECTCEECECGDCECETCNEEEDIQIDEIRLLTEKNTELENKLLRNQAELFNYKRRKDEETERILKYSNMDLIKEILPILDSFERAINMDNNNLSDEVSKFLNGFKMTYETLKKVLSNFDVIEIDALGKVFDPNIHQAVMIDEVKDKKSDIILEVLQKGYMLKDKVIRPAMVKVNK